jgi:hypothetical protein
MAVGRNVRETFQATEKIMDRLSTSGLLTQALAALRTVRTRSWLILGGIVLFIIVLVVWTGIALLSWLWAQAPTATELGRLVVTEGATRIEQVAPDLKAQAERAVTERAARVEQVAPDLKAQAELWLPGVKEQVDRWVPGLGDQPPARDVSGADPGPVPRFPGLMRSQYANKSGTTDVHYAGRADFDAVLAHYVQGFAGAGYVQEVVSATPEAEQHRFRRGHESFDLELTRRPGGTIAVRLQQSSRQ